MQRGRVWWRCVTGLGEPLRARLLALYKDLGRDPVARKLFIPRVNTGDGFAPKVEDEAAADAHDHDSPDEDAHGVRRGEPQEEWVDRAGELLERVFLRHGSTRRGGDDASFGFC